MNLHGDITLKDSGSHIQMGSMWYSVLTFSYVDSKEWTLLFVPDDGIDMYFLLGHCRCGGYQLRIVSSYTMFIRPGMAQPRYKLHNVGEGFTHTPGLNVLRCDNIIKGDNKEVINGSIHLTNLENLAPYGYLSLQLLIRQDMNRRFIPLYTNFLNVKDIIALFQNALLFCNR